jgi:SHAQKYF class myb-like DNA-binding protein
VPEEAPAPAPAPAEEGGAGKRPRLVWSPALHARFVDAVTHLGIKAAVPKTIMQARDRACATAAAHRHAAAAPQQQLTCVRLRMWLDR